MIKRKTAFTLAEVLITLAVIGIIAALTIPNVVANYKKTAYTACFKKFHARMVEVFKMMRAMEGVETIQDADIYINKDDAGKVMR